MRRIIALLTLTGILLCGCGSVSEEVPSTTEPEISTAATEAPTEAPTEEPTEAPTEEPTEAPTEPPFPLHSGIREDGSFDEHTLFIGDSLTYGLVSLYLKDNHLQGDAMYMAYPGAPPTVYFNGPSLSVRDPRNCLLSSYDFNGLLMSKAVELVGDQVHAVYFMMGTNHVDAVCTDTYIEIVEHLLATCPNATIYLQLVPYSWKSHVPYEDTNQWIREAYALFAERGETRVQCVDTFTAIGDNINTDGIHLTIAGQEEWYKGLVAYAKENDIPQ